MRHTSALIGALLLALALATTASAVAPGGAAASPVVSPGEDSPNYLAIPADEVAASNLTRVDVDVASAVDADAAILQARYVEESFAREFTAASDENRTAVLRETLDAIENETDRLVARQRAAMTSLANGSIGTTTFLRQRAAIQARAAPLQSTLASMQRVTPDNPDSAALTRLNTRIDTVAGRLEVLQGPVSGMTMRHLTVDDAGPITYVETSGESYTLAYIRDGTYVRETFLGPAWQDGTDTFADAIEGRLTAARARGEELYPWMANHSVGTASRALGDSGIYRYRTEFQGGSLTAYIDGNSTDVFRETQNRSLASVDVTSRTTEVGDDLLVQVNRTFDTGPMSIQLRDADSNAPIEGRLIVERQPLGSTGADGQRWTIEPRGQVRINATARGETVTVIIPP